MTVRWLREVARGWGLACVIAIGLTGCASPVTHSISEQGWTGRLWLRVASEPVQTLNADFELQGSADSGELRLLSPLGSTLAVARWSPGTTELQHSGRVDAYPNMDTLTEQLTGAALPLPALFAWLRGTPHEAHGWQVDLRTFAQGRLQARRLEPLPEVELRLRLLTPESP